MQENKNVLVTGGAGYVGAHVCKELARRGYIPVVFDNFSTGHEDFVRFPEGGPPRLVEGDIRNPDDIDTAMYSASPSAVIHCAALATVNEENAIENYYEHNIAGTLNVLCAMRKRNVKRIVYVSTGAGHESLYGSTKRMAERLITQFYLKHGITYGILRLQNVAGASPDGDIGERHEPETHLVANACLVAAGKKDKLTVYGDGNTSRDYVHVMDVAQEIADAMESEDPTLFDHVGSGILCSVNAVIGLVLNVSGKQIQVEYGTARAGDAPNVKPLKATCPRRGINEIIGSAYAWHSR